MGHTFSDWKWACVAALGLLGIAAFIVFVLHPGGFEGQVGWFFGVLPGAIPAEFLSDYAFKVVPRAERIVYWTLVFGINFLWHFVLSYAVIKFGRFITGY